MKLFDSSAIINICSSGDESSLLDGSTISLALYEVGNSVWRQVNLQKKLTMTEGSEAFNAISNVIGKMETTSIMDAHSILKMACEEHITFYDASYICAAIQEKATLVTDDNKLRLVAGKYVEAISSEDANSKVMTPGGSHSKHNH